MIVNSYRCDVCQRSIEEGLIIHGPIDLIVKHYKVHKLFGTGVHVCLDCIGETIDSITDPEPTPLQKLPLPK